MSATAAPFGMRPVYHPSGRCVAQAFPAPFSAAYGTAVYRGSPVILDTSGVLVIGTTNADILGVFDGVEYTDSNGRRQFSPMWPASLSATDIVAYVYTDPLIVYEIQSDGSLASSALGDQADFVNPGNGTAITGLSSAAINSTLGGAGVQKQLRIVELAPYVDNAWSDSYTIVRVQIARHQYVSSKVAI